MEVINIIESYESAIETDSNNILILLNKNNLMIGKHQDKICFVIKSTGGQKKRYKNGDMSISLNSTYLLENVKGIYSVIFYKNEDRRRIEIFIQTLMTCVGDKSITSEELFELYNEISEVFRSIPFDYNSFIGTFGELLFIKYIFSKYKVNLVSYYQSNSTHLVDFKYNETIFEVKTTSSNNRLHEINNDQLRGDGYMCSIKVIEDNTGTSVQDLFEEIKDLFKDNPIRLLYIENYILGIPPIYLKDKYDIDFNKIKFYLFDSLPKIKNYHESISKIRFTIDLTNFTPDSIDRLFEH